MSAAIEELSGARLQRVDGPRPRLFVLGLHRPGGTGWLLLSLTEPVAWGWVDARPRGEPASSFVRLLRKHLENARVLEVVAHAAGGTIELARGESRARLHLLRTPPNLVLELDGAIAHALDPHALAAAGLARGAPLPAPPQGEPALASDLAALTRAGPAILSARTGADAEARRTPLLKAARRQAARLRKRLAAIDGDLAREADAALLRDRASRLLAHLAHVPRGATEALVPDWSGGGPIAIPIRAGRTPREEADALFTRARKVERGGLVARDRRALTEQELGRLDALLARLEAADEDALDALEAEAAALGIATPSVPGRARAPSPRAPYRAFFGTGGRTILVGRSARENDALTLGARPWDEWLHARGVPGSHVVVPLERAEECPDPLRLDAAHLAAHFSEARGEARVDITCCARRHVRKPKGSPPGAVRIERERVVVLRLEPERLARLLASEKPPPR